MLDSCQAAISLPIIWTSFAGNVSTDIYLLSIPIPLLWESTLKLPKKIASTVVLGAGIFCTACATMKSIFVLVVCSAALVSCKTNKQSSRTLSPDPKRLAHGVHAKPLSPWSSPTYLEFSLFSKICSALCSAVHRAPPNTVRPQASVPLGAVATTGSRTRTDLANTQTPRV